MIACIPSTLRTLTAFFAVLQLPLIFDHVAYASPMRSVCAPGMSLHCSPASIGQPLVDSSVRNIATVNQEDYSIEELNLREVVVPGSIANGVNQRTISYAIHRNPISSLTVFYPGGIRERLSDATMYNIVHLVQGAFQRNDEEGKMLPIGKWMPNVIMWELPDVGQNSGTGGKSSAKDINRALRAVANEALNLEIAGVSRSKSNARQRLILYVT